MAELVTIPFSNPGVAGVETGDTYTQVEVFYGEKTPVTRLYDNAHTGELPIYTAVKLNAGKTGFVPAQAGDEVFGVTSTVSRPGDSIDLYLEAYFNTDAVAFHPSFDTFAKKRAAFSKPGLYADRIPTHGRAIPARTIPA